MELKIKERERWIDNAKGIAIILVMIGHLCGDQKGIWKFEFVYGIHLVIFFLITGYTIKRKDLTLKFLNDKFERLMVPYFFTCIAILITDIVNSYISKNNSIDIITNIIVKDLTRSFFASGAITTFGSIEVGTRIGAIWFLPAMFFAVIIFQIILNHFEDKDDISGAVSAFISIVGYVSARFIWLPFSIQAGMMSVFFIWIGYVIKKKQILSSLKTHNYLVALTVLLIGIRYGYCNVGFVVAYINDWIISTIVGLSGCLLIYWCSIKYKGRFLEYAGKNSLLILCTHLYFLETMWTQTNKLLDDLGLCGGAYRAFSLIVVGVIFAALGAFFIDRVIVLLKYKFIRCENTGLQNVTDRDSTGDVLKGIVIILMLVAEFPVNENFRNLIYSCDLITVIFILGYFYEKSDGCGNLKNIIKWFFIPYLLYSFFDIGINNEWNKFNLKNCIIRYLLGMSNSENILFGVEKVGAVWFILMLFAIKVCYLFIENCIKNEKDKWIAIIVMSLYGAYLGSKGYWLPWSIDVALYCLIYYKLGMAFKDKNVIEFVENNPFIYFLISPIWIYMIYVGSINLAKRNYGQYGLSIIGSIMGVLTICILVECTTRYCLLLRGVLKRIGQELISILIIHTLLDGRIKSIMSVRFNYNSFTFLCACVTIEIVLAISIKYIIETLVSGPNVVNPRST